MCANYHFLFSDGCRNQNDWDTGDGGADLNVNTANEYAGGKGYQQSQRKLVSGSQSFILGAVIHTTNKVLPYQNAMVQNYLQVRSCLQKKVLIFK